MSAAGEIGRESGGLGALRITGLVLAAIALTGFFMVLRFPYDRLADVLAARLERDSGTRISLGHVSPGWVRWGPGLEATDVRVQQPDGTRVELARVAARPALSVSWLSGTPALAAEIEAPVANASGVVTFGETASFSGTLRDVDLAQLPLEGLGPRAHLEGTADAEVDLVTARSGPEGSVRFVAREGSFAHPNLPLALPFQEIRGDVLLGGDQWAEIRELVLDSPVASGNAKGTIGRSASFDAAPLDLRIDLTVGEAIRGSLGAQGVDVGRDGRIEVRVMGTPARPIVR